MFFFKKKRERKNAEKLAKQKQIDAQNKKEVKKDKAEVQPVSSNEKVASLKVRPYTLPTENDPVTKPVVKPKETPVAAKKVDPKPIEKPVVKTADPKVKEVAEKKVAQKINPKKPAGKYEIYPEGDYYKFRLKASNGEILCVSFRYSTVKGARTGMDTFIKNVEEGQFVVVTDKNDYSQFFLYNQAGARFIIVGEVYKDVKQAYSAVESVRNFYKTDRIDVLDEIPVGEVREEAIKFDKVEEVSTGKYEIYKENDFYYIRLIASNGQVMLNSQGYSTKATAKSGLNTIKNAIKIKNFTISRDKQNRYQFNLYSTRGQLILAGETYPVKASGISAAHSVLKFGLKASVVEK